MDMEVKGEVPVIHLDDVDPVATEEQRLSQQMSCLSASQETAITTKKRATQVNTGTITVKKMKTEKDVPSDHHLPSYLSANNNIFDQRMNPILQKLATSITIEDLRTIAHVVHNLALTKLFVSLWQVYLNSGTGQLTLPNEQQQKSQKSIVENPNLWPSAVKTTMIRERVTSAQNESDITPTSCLTFTQNYLHQLTSKAAQFQAELTNQNHRLFAFTMQMNQAIERFVHEHYMNQMGLTIEAKIATTEYDYRDHIIELEFLQLKPNDHQVK